MTKDELRRHIKQEIQRPSAAERDTQSLYVCLQILGSPEWQQSRTVLLYAALPDEVSLQLLIDDAVGSGKQVILPVVHGDTLLLRHYDPQHIEVQGKFRIEEPTEACPQLDDPSLIDLAIIPGRAFSRKGHRMGRGKGYYDRLLPQLLCPKWGVCFTCQLQRMVPCDEWDVRMNKVVTA